MCPDAEQLLGQLPEMGYGADRVVPVAFHVDYFNQPWKDPFSDPLFSRREYEYSRIYQREHKSNDPNYLYFTPMVMVDGRRPMLGTDRAKLRAALKSALAEKPGVSLALALDGAGDEPRRKTLKVTVTALSPKLVDQKVLIGVATHEDPVTTKVASGENAGKTLVEHSAARRLAVQAAKPSREPKTLSFPIELDEDWDAPKCGLVVFAQDETTGRIHQAASIPWQGDRKANRADAAETRRGR